MQKTIKLSLILGALLSQLHAQNTNEVKLNTFEVTSTAISTDELRSTDAVEVYTQEDIEKSHVKSLYEFLNTQTSVTAIPSFGNPFSQLMDIRGYGSANGHENILITVNGRKMNNIDSLPQLLSSIAPSAVSRIEIIKSSGIVIGGDGANAGTINITTKKNNNKEITLYGGTYGTYSASAYIGHSDDTLSVSASGEAQGTKGARHIDNQGNKDKNLLRNATFNLAYTPNEELELRFGASATKSDVFYGGSLTKAQYDSDPSQFAGSTFHQIFNTNSLSAGVTYNISDALSISVDANREKKKSDFVPTFSGASYYTYNSGTIVLDYISDSFSFTVGGDLFKGDREQTSNTTTKDNVAGFAMAEFYAGKSTFKAGYRIETVSYRYKSTTKDLNQNDDLRGMELGYNYAFDNEKSIFVNYSHSYQAPNIDKFFNFGGTFNGFINPMKSNNYNLGFNYFTPSNKLKVALYYIDLEDEIYFYKDVFPNSKNTNIDKSHKYGLDIYDKVIFSNEFNAVLNYNYVKAIIDDETENGDNFAGKELPGVSNHSIKATLNYMPTKQYTFSLTQEYRSEAYAANDFNNNFSQKQDAYRSTDIAVTYAKDNYEFFAKINNLFNQANGIWIRDDAIYPVNFTTTATAGMKLRF